MPTRDSNFHPITTARWTVENAALEFGLDRKTLTGRIKTSGVLAGEDGMFSTKSIARAIYSDSDGARLRKTNEEADKLALENARTRKELADLALVRQDLSELAAAARRILEGSHLSEQDQEFVLNAFAPLFAYKG